MRLTILIAVTHLLGAGHLTRAAALARAFVRAGHRATLVSGGMPAPLVDVSGVDFVQNRPVQIAGTDFRNLLDEAGQPFRNDGLKDRSGTLVRTIRDRRPDVVVTELFPFGRRGLAAEFLALVDAARELRPQPLIVCSIRDILVTPARAERIEEAHRQLADLYNLVLVHGDPDLAPLEASWPVSPRLAGMLRYTGYVDEGPPVRPDGQRSGIIVSGGSSAASLPLYRAAIGTAGIVLDEPWTILVGNGVPESVFADLKRAAPGNASVERARRDFRETLAGAALSVSQAGYNTAIDVLRAEVPAVFVPFEAGNESEQRLRAERLQALGRASVVPEADLSPTTLAAAIREMLGRALPPLGVRLDGAERSVAIVEVAMRGRADGRHSPPPSAGEGQPAGGRQGEGPPSIFEYSPRPLPARSARHPPPRRGEGLRDAGSPHWEPPPTPNPSPRGGGEKDRALDAALSRAAGLGLSVWWRDDDAVAGTPALERLLALSRAYRIPVALAAVPARAEASLAERLSGESLARLLVHGLTHRNHAPAGEKKAEFGAHRSLDVLRTEAAEALGLARARLGPRLLPIFVPPWNRIAPGLAASLPALGYTGLSTAKARRAASPAPGLTQVNVHIDPIDWRGARGARNGSAVLADLARAILDRVEGRADPSEPIGLLTHHLAHDEALWHLTESLLERLSRSGRFRYPFADELFSSLAGPVAIELQSRYGVGGMTAGTTPDRPGGA